MSFCSLPSQCSSSFSSISTPAGIHLTQHPAQSTSFTASHIPTCGQDSQSPGSRLPPSGPDGFYAIRPGFSCRKPASDAGASDTPPDQDASVSISHFTGMHTKAALVFGSQSESMAVPSAHQQAMVSVPLRSQTGSSPAQVPTSLSVSAVAVAKPQTVSPGSPGTNPGSPALLQGVTNPNIKQVN